MTFEYEHKHALDPLHTVFVDADVVNPSFYANRFSRKIGCDHHGVKRAG